VARLVQRGVPLFTVKELLGHSTITLTERYASLRPADLDDAVAVLD
jgi:site-specific recombinase XerD